MKILQITPAFPPSEFGGVKIQSYYLSRELVRRGHDVTVYTSNARNREANLDRKGLYEIDGIKVIYLNNCLSNKYILLFFTPGIAKLLRDELKKYDIVHLHDPRAFQSIAARYYCSKYKVPYVLSPQGSLPQAYEWVFIKKLYDYLFGRKILADASQVIALTSTEAEQCRKSGIEESKIVQIPNGINIDEYEQLPERGAFREKYSIKEENIILFLGRIHKIKGLDILAAAFAELLRHRQDARLVIVGQDHGYLTQLKEILRKLNIEDKVTFTGFLSGRAKLEAYVNADVYVLPSIYETFPNTVLEACACGTPVILTDRCGIADIIGGQVGLVVHCDKGELSNAILRMLSDDKMTLQFGERGKLLVREKFSEERVAKQVEDVYQAILAKRQHSRH